MKKKYALGIVGTCGLPASYGGFETLASALVDYLAANDYKILVGAQRGCLPRSSFDWSQFVLPIPANGPASVPYDFASILIASLHCRLVFVLGVSGAVFLPVFRLIFPSVRYVVHIDGIEWSRPKWSGFAKLFLRLSERFAVHSADAFIVDNQGIADYVARTYGARYLKRASLVAYGATGLGDDSFSRSLLEVTNALDQGRVSLVDTKYLLVLGRAEPENNFSMIIESFIASGLADHGFLLLIISNISDTSYGRELLSSYSLCANILFACPDYDTRRVRALRASAYAYIHGHSAGGTNPSLVEAMSSSRPIFAFDVPFNRYTTFDLASYFSSSSQLTKSLMFLLRERLEAVPSLGKYASAEYNWSKICSDYRLLFDKVDESRASGARLLWGRFFLRLRRKAGRLFVMLLVSIRAAIRKSRTKYEPKLPRGY